MFLKRSYKVRFSVKVWKVEIMFSKRSYKVRFSVEVWKVEIMFSKCSYKVRFSVKVWKESWDHVLKTLLQSPVFSNDLEKWRLCSQKNLKKSVQFCWVIREFLQCHIIITTPPSHLSIQFKGIIYYRIQGLGLWICSPEHFTCEYKSDQQ